MKSFRREVGRSTVSAWPKLPSEEVRNCLGTVERSITSSSAVGQLMPPICKTHIQPLNTGPRANQVENRTGNITVVCCWASAMSVSRPQHPWLCATMAMLIRLGLCRRLAQQPIRHVARRFAIPGTPHPLGHHNALPNRLNWSEMGTIGALIENAGHRSGACSHSCQDGRPGARPETSTPKLWDASHEELLCFELRDDRSTYLR